MVDFNNKIFIIVDKKMRKSSILVRKKNRLIMGRTENVAPHFYFCIIFLEIKVNTLVLSFLEAGFFILAFSF